MLRISGVGADDADGLGIGAVGEIEAAQAVVGGGKAEPGLGVARMRLDRVAEMLLGQAEIVGAVCFLPSSVRRSDRCRAGPASASAGAPSGGGTNSALGLVGRRAANASAPGRCFAKD